MSVLFKNTKPLKELHALLLEQLQNTNIVKKLYIVSNGNGDVSKLTLIFKPETNLGTWSFIDRAVDNEVPTMLDFDHSTYPANMSVGCYTPAGRDNLPFRDTNLPLVLKEIANSDIVSIVCYSEELDSPVNPDDPTNLQLQSFRELMGISDSIPISLAPN